MRGKRDMFQMKEQGKTSEKDHNDMEISNRPDKEFKVMLAELGGRCLQMLTELGGRMNEHI